MLKLQNQRKISTETFIDVWC